jgi:hypothetical protein
VEPADTADAPKTATVATKTEKSNGATDLTGGNKFQPAETAATSHDATESAATKDEAEKVTPATEETADNADSVTANDPDTTAKSGGASGAEGKAAA